MKASEAKVGEKYLSRTGIPVTLVGSKAGKFQIKLETTGTAVGVNGDYELRPYDEKGIDKESRILLKLNGKGKGGKTKAKKAGSLSAIIDPYLLAGGKMVAEIAAEVTKKAGEAAKGRDINANVRARLVCYTRKGWQVVKDDKKRVKVVRKTA
ncbi:MAG: hypothetical protein A2X28_06420 [Elusimicrobia bacterium GWA2_56_46]|nr:MAG: hypothetical protein A2X28_06420 [Elusimicrobia bacterium GWA2_56_46]OGR54912.1 MAG: hypothetical protein A2X39_11570 [Elusimicrobia bacterium GWC2_56_31]HBW23292.1 hypothetical protein [Elusimicrobiota bacterium]